MVELTANFANGGLDGRRSSRRPRRIDVTSIGTDTANTNGNAYLKSYQVNGEAEGLRADHQRRRGSTESRPLTPTAAGAIAPTGPDTGTLTETPTTFEIGDTIQLGANFPNGTFPVTLYEEGPAGTWTASPP